MKIGVIGDDFTGSSDAANTLARAGGRGRCSMPACPRTRRRRDRRGGDRAQDPLGRRRPRRWRSRWPPAAGWRRTAPADRLQILLDLRFHARGQHRPGRRGAARRARRGRWRWSARPSRPPGGRSTRAISSSHDRLSERVGHGEAPADADDRPRLSAAGSATRRGCRSGTCRSRRCARTRDGGAGASGGRGARLVVADAIDDADLLRLGRAARGHRLVTGGSGILLGLPANFGIEPGAAARAFAGRERTGRWCWPAAARRRRCRQVARLCRGHPVLRLDGRGRAGAGGGAGAGARLRGGEPRRRRRWSTSSDDPGGGGRGAGAPWPRAAGGGLRGDLRRG